LHIHGATSSQTEQKQKNKDFYSHELHKRQLISGFVDQSGILSALIY